MIGRRHVDASTLDRLAIARVFRGQRTGTLQDAMQHARVVGRHVQDDADRGGKILGQSSDQAGERLDTTGRRTNYDEIASDHGIRRSGARSKWQYLHPYR